MLPRHLLLPLCLALAATPVSARMYEWVNPGSGRVQMSGDPPSWYRASAPGPRVRVYDNGALVDDTAIALTAGENAALREYAVSRAEEQRNLAALRDLEQAAARRAAQAAAQAEDEQRAADLAQRRREADDAAAETAPEPTPTGLTPEEALVAEALDGQTIERLKALISEFDQVGTGR